MSERRILVMDDEKVILDIATKMLTVLGFKTDTASEGQEAYDRFVRAREEGRPYCAVILNNVVPSGLGGAETMKLIKSADPEIRVIVSTGFSSESSRAEYERVGFDGVLNKPYRVRDVKEVLEQLKIKDDK